MVPIKHNACSGKMMILKSQVDSVSFFRHSSRDGSPASSYRHHEKAQSTTPAPSSGDFFDGIPDQMPVMPVLILLVLDITFGNFRKLIGYPSS